MKNKIIIKLEANAEKAKKKCRKEICKRQPDLWCFPQLTLFHLLPFFMLSKPNVCVQEKLRYSGEPGEKKTRKEKKKEKLDKTGQEGKGNGIDSTNRKRRQEGIRRKKR